MATSSESLLTSEHAFKATVEERGLGPFWDCFTGKKISTWSAMGLAMGYSPHESSEATAQRWADQVMKPLCRLQAKDDEDGNCITVRRLQLDAWTLVHSEARRLGSETVPGNRVPAPLGPPDRRARRKEFEEKSLKRSLKGEEVPAVCLFDDPHEMWEERRLVWQPPQNCPSRLDEDKLRAVKPRNDGSGVEEKLKRKPRPTIDIKSLRDLELACFRRSVTLEEHAFIPFTDVQTMLTDKYTEALTTEPVISGYVKPTLHQILAADQYIWTKVGERTEGVC